MPFRLDGSQFLIAFSITYCLCIILGLFVESLFKRSSFYKKLKKPRNSNEYNALIVENKNEVITIRFDVDTYSDSPFEFVKKDICHKIAMEILKQDLFVVEVEPRDLNKVNYSGCVKIIKPIVQNEKFKM